LWRPSAAEVLLFLIVVNVCISVLVESHVSVCAEAAECCRGAAEVLLAEDSIKALGEVLQVGCC
jgi:hypothetical protein